MTILISGAAGFIGFHLIKKLADRHKIIGIDNINNYYSVDLKYARLKELGIDRSEIDEHQKAQSTIYPTVYFYKTDIRNRQELNDIFEKENIDIVCHLAAQAGVRYSFSHPEEYITNNQVGFFNIIETSAKNNIKKFIFASSSSIYGLNKTFPFSEDAKTDMPASIYAATKKSNELLAHSYSHLHNMQCIGLRFFTVYGEWGRPDMAPTLFASRISKGKAINVFNNGNMERDFTYIDDIIEGVMKVIQSEIKKKFAVYNIGRGKAENLMKFIRLIEAELGKKVKINFLPMQAGDVQKTFADISKLKKDFGYKPTTNIETGVKKFVNWYKKYYGNDKNTNS